MSTRRTYFQIRLHSRVVTDFKEAQVAVAEMTPYQILSDRLTSFTLPQNDNTFQSINLLIRSLLNNEDASNPTFFSSRHRPEVRLSTECDLQQRYLDTCKKLLDVLIKSQAGTIERPTWFTVDCDKGNPILNLVEINDSFYSGRLGVAVLFAAAFTVFKEESYRDLANRIVRTLGSYQNPLESQKFLGLDGIGGELFGRFIVNKFLGNDGDSDLEVGFNKKIRCAEKYQEYGFVDGPASFFVGALSSNNSEISTIKPVIIDDLKQRMLQIRSKLSVDPSSIKQTMAHGILGTLTAALIVKRDYPEFLNDQQHDRYILECLSHSIELSNENDCGVSWCRGHVGVGIPALICHQLFSESHLSSQLRTILHKIQVADYPMVDTLCCGRTGAADLLLSSSIALDEPSYLKSSEQICLEICEHLRSWDFSKLQFYPGLYRGIAGIGYQLLRSSYPTGIPSLLTLSRSMEVSHDS